MIKSYLDFAALLASGWKLSFEEKLIPTDSNYLDLALKEVSSHTALNNFRKDLRFVIRGNGTQSYFLEESLNAGVESCLIGLDSSSFSCYRVLIGKDVASIFLKRIKIEEDSAISFCNDLHDAYKRVKNETLEFSSFQ